MEWRPSRVNKRAFVVRAPSFARVFSCIITISANRREISNHYFINGVGDEWNKLTIACFNIRLDCFIDSNNRC